MSSRSLSIPSLQTRNQARLRVSYRALSAQTILAVSVALFILFLWMHFILAMQIESTGRQIMIKAEELDRLERNNAALQRTIAEVGSQEILTERAKGMGYERQTPVYLLLSEPLHPSAGGGARDGSHLPTNTGGNETSLPQVSSLLHRVTQTFDVAPETNAEP